MLAEEAHPYLAGFLLWILPTATMFFGLDFLDRYTWLRDVSILPAILTIVGVLMVLTGGILSAFQNHLGRIMGYAVIVGNGFSLLALSLGGQISLKIFLLQLVPRTLCLGIWALSLSILRESAPGLNLQDVRKLGRSWPFAAAGLILANLALAGMPLLADFPLRLAIWEGMAASSLPLALCVLIGSLGFFASAVRTLTALTSAPEGTPWGTRETLVQRLLLLTGMLGLFLLGLFPQWALPLWKSLPALFTHLTQ